MRAILTHFAFEFRSGVRDRSSLLMIYLFPLIFFLIVSGIMGKMNPAFKDTILYTMPLFAMLSSLLLSMPGTGVAQREAGVFRSFKTNGVPSWTLLAMPILSLCVHLLLVTGIIWTIALVAMGAAWPASAARYAAGWVCGILSISSLGAIILVLAPNNRASILLSQLLFLPSMMLGSLMIPSQALGGTLGTISACLPTSLAMRVFLGQRGWEASVALLVVGALAGFIAAAALFEWDAKNPKSLPKKLLALIALVPYAAGAFLA